MHWLRRYPGIGVQIRGIRLSKARHLLEEGAQWLSVVLVGVAAALLAAMMFLTGTDVILRYLFNRPLVGPYELTESMMLLIVFLGLANTQLKKGHVSVDLVVPHFSPRVQAIANSVTTLISLGVLSLISWQIILLAKVDWERGLISSTLGFPVAPVLFLVAFAAIVFCLILLTDLINNISAGMK